MAKVAPEVVAVDIRNVYKVYRDRNSSLHVLNGLTLTLPRGTIYGLLGPSGCGKTTLLKCILGRISIDAGHLSVFGKSPFVASSVGRIGFMPQEVALINNLTIWETLRFFGNIYGMDSQDIEKRSKFLIDLLDIPTKKQLVGTFSGGQKRRASFAASLINEPELLILDEPTVGVEPVLRQSLWNHLSHLTQTKNTTIIVTTHYIEESRMAHNVGLMMNGTLLASDSPDSLIAQHGCLSLEQVFLKLCIISIQSESVFTNKESENIISKQRRNSAEHLTTMRMDYNQHNLHQRKPDNFTWVKRIKALFITNMLTLKRNPVNLALQLFLPTLVTFMCTIAIGKPMFGLPIAVVNNDLQEFSKLFLNSIDSNTLIQIPYDDFDEARKGTENGETWAAINIGPNFTKAIKSRFEDLLLVDDDMLNQSTLTIFLETSNAHIQMSITYELQISYRKFIKDAFTNHLDLNPLFADFPITYAKTQVYGDFQLPFTQFLVPSLFLIAVFFAAASSTSLTMSIEKKLGSYERTVLAGVTFMDLMVSQMLRQLVVMVMQVFLMMFMALFIFGYTCKGSYALMVVLIFLQGLCGNGFGFLTSFMSEPVNGLLTILGTYFVVIMTEGTFFSVEGLPMYFRYISEIGIQTYPAEAMRSIMNRGWGLTHGVVYMGFVVTIVWLTIFCFFSWLLFKIKK